MEADSLEGADPQALGPQVAPGVVVRRHRGRPLHQLPKARVRRPHRLTSYSRTTCVSCFSIGGLRLTSPQEGNSFFDGWTYFTAADPTDGNVQYVDSATAVRLIVRDVERHTHRIPVGLGQLVGHQQRRQRVHAR